MRRFFIKNQCSKGGALWISIAFEPLGEGFWEASAMMSRAPGVCTACVPWVWNAYVPWVWNVCGPHARDHHVLRVGIMVEGVGVRL